jgi:hypothetical protein
MLVRSTPFLTCSGGDRGVPARCRRHELDCDLRLAGIFNSNIMSTAVPRPGLDIPDAGTPVVMAIGVAVQWLFSLAVPNRIFFKV